MNIMIMINLECFPIRVIAGGDKQIVGLVLAVAATNELQQNGNDDDHDGGHDDDRCGGHDGGHDDDHDDGHDEDHDGDRDADHDSGHDADHGCGHAHIIIFITQSLVWSLQLIMLMSKYNFAY